MVWSSSTGTAALFPAISLMIAPVGIRSRKVPADVGVTTTVNTPGLGSVMAPTTIDAVPALLKSLAETLDASMSSLKVTV